MKTAETLQKSICAGSETAAGGRVSDHMSSPVVTVSVDAPAAEIARLLEEHRISAVPVVDGGHLVGLVSTTDLLSAGCDSTCRARDIMSSPAVIARGDEPLEAAAWRMAAARVHRVVVTEGESVVGILSARDILDEVVCRRNDEPIRSVMRTPVESVGIGETVDVALARLLSANVHGLLVVDAMAPVGLFTHTEALACQRLPAALRDQPVETVMNHQMLCLDSTTKIRRAAAYAAVMNARRIIVLDGKHLVGIVSAMDLVRSLAHSTDSSVAASA